MRIKLLVLCALCVFTANACREAGTTASTTENNNQATTVNNSSGTNGESGATASTMSATPAPKKNGDAQTSSNQPKTVRDYFMLLPQKYFVLEGCEPKTDKDCQKAKLDYLKTFVDVEDTQNGYLKGGCDGAQSCLEMALFKRPDGSYLVGVSTFAEMMEDSKFLDYRNGNWTDVSAQVVPQYSRKNIYEQPRYGTVVKVFAKKVIEKGKDYEISERGAKLYDLEWKDGKFTIKK
jgi:hypothetical protein